MRLLVFPKHAATAKHQSVNSDATLYLLIASLIGFLS